MLSRPQAQAYPNASSERLVTRSPVDALMFWTNRVVNVQEVRPERLLLRAPGISAVGHWRIPANAAKEPLAKPFQNGKYELIKLAGYSCQPANQAVVAS